MKNKKVKTILELLGLLLLLIAIPLTVWAVKTKRLEIREKALVKTTPPTSFRMPTIETFKISYQQMIERYSGGLRDIQLFGGGLVLSEFDDDHGTNNVYAGHLGSFWAPPHYSDFGWNKSKWQEGGFNLGLVFQTNSTCFTEEPSDLGSEAFWYPSKLVISKNYPNPIDSNDGNIKIKGVKVALPGKRGFGLKLTLTNKTSSVQSYHIMFLGYLPTFSTLTKDDGDGKYGPWNWLMRDPSDPQQTNAKYDSSSSTIIITPTNNNKLGYLAIATNERPSSWTLDNEKMPPYYSFRQNCSTGELNNQDNDNSNYGSAYGLVGDFTNLNPNESKTITLVTGIGSTEQEAREIVSEFRNKDIEAEADRYWNNKLASIFSLIPQLETADATLNQIYLNSVLSYLVNKWDTFNAIGESAGYGQSISLFPWKTGNEGFFAFDNIFWKEQLVRMLSLDQFHCRAYDPVGHDHLCDSDYSYNRVSTIDAVYKYIVATKDFGFLNENINGKPVIEYLKRYLAFDDDLAKDNQLADFGHDWKLYEYTRHAEVCDLGGKYTGKVVSPNAERVIAHRQVAELAKKLGEGQYNYARSQLEKAESIKSDINNLLWNPSKKWFDSISLWDANLKPRPTPYKNTFYNVIPYFLLQYDNLLSQGQIEGLMSHFNEFREPYGLTSLSKTMKKSDGTWCSEQTDWHGPGIYSGALGAVLIGLYKQGYANLAYDVLLPPDGKGYAYLSQIPYFSQAFHATEPKTTLNLGYYEGVSIAQSVIEGMFGFQPKIDYVQIFPHIPQRLLDKGSISLKNIHAQGCTWEISVSPTGDQTIKMIVNETEHNHETFHFAYGINGKLNLQVENLIPNKDYILTFKSINNGEVGEVKKIERLKTNNAAMLSKTLELNGLYLIEGAPAIPEQIIGRVFKDDAVVGNYTITSSDSKTAGWGENDGGPYFHIGRWSAGTDVTLTLDNPDEGYDCSWEASQIVADKKWENLGSGEGCSGTITVVPGYLSPDWHIHWGFHLTSTPISTVTPTPTATPSPIPTSTPTVTPTHTPSPTPSTTPTTPTPPPTSTPIPPTSTSICASCPAGKPLKSLGNANCDGVIDLKDFILWLDVYRRIQGRESVSKDEKAQVNFNCSSADTHHAVDLQDFGVWLNEYRGRM